jgi:gamma-glutamyltranspeptidase/glutathione hydrolase
MLTCPAMRLFVPRSRLDLAARGQSLPSPKRAEPARLLRCSSVKYVEYSPSSRLASGPAAPILARSDFAHGLLAVVFAVGLVNFGCASPAQSPAAKSASANAAVPSAEAAATMPAGWPYPARATVPPATGGVVASDSTLATKVGIDVLAAGGNAADAAVAVAFALAVVYPAAGNLGGGGFAVARIGPQTRALDFRETAPAAASRDMYLDASGKNDGGSREGHRSSGVPGSVAGLYELHHELGSKTKSWADLIAPAIKLAEEGFAADAGFVEFAGRSERLKKNPASAALFFPDAQPVQLGQIWKNPDLGKVLRLIAARGPAGFYEGPTAKAIADEMKANGGLITLADLAGYKAKWRTPLEFSYRGHTVLAMPPPSSGGLTVAMIAHIVEKYDLPSMPWHSPAELHILFEAMRRSFAARNAKLGDPDFVKNPIDELMSPKWADEQRASIKPDRATPSSEIAGAAPSGNGPHTTHFSVLDGKGGAVALTTTLNFFFGNGITVPGTGMVLNNEMDDFASVPGNANGFGLVQGEPNAIAAGKRMLSSMAPTIVLGRDGQIDLVAGAAGGPTIITAVFEIMSNVLDHGMDPVAAVSAPRFHMQHLPDVVANEKGGITPQQQQVLGAMGYTFKDRGHIADALAIGRVPGGWIGAAEPRRLGSLALGR